MSRKLLNLLGWPRGLEIFTRTPLTPTVPNNQPLRKSEGTAKAPRGLFTAQNTAQVLLLLLLAAPAHAVVVFGDSISACRTCWPAQLQAQGEWYKVLAQSMRFALNYEIPADLAPIDGHTEAVYFLGTNDSILDAAYPGEVFPHWRQQFNGHISTLLSKGYRVLVVILPTMPIEGMHRFREYQQLYCAVAVYHFKVPGLSCFDPDAIGYVTTDGVHPTEETSRLLADAIGAALQEQG